MKPEDIKPGHRYVIDMAPLIASPEPSGATFIGTVSSLRETPRDGRFYVLPEKNTPLYISAHWFIKEAPDEQA